MNSFRRGLVCLLACLAARLGAAGDPAGPRQLPGELTAAQLLDGVQDFPASPPAEWHEEAAGLDRARLSPVPPPGVHPRVLLSPGDLPDLRRRLATTQTGRKLFARLQERVQETIGRQGSLLARFYAACAAGDDAAVVALVRGNGGNLPDGVGHYQPCFYAFVLEAFADLVNDDAGRGRQVAAAIAGYARLIQPLLEDAARQPLGDNVWRARVPADAPWGAGLSPRDLVGYHLLGYAYDFAFNFMTPPQQADTRRAIATATAGKVWMGANLPHHWRNWNWVAIGLGQPLLALAIEGEPGYDPRVYRLGTEIARDYLTYAISAGGASTEAVGYTQFGFVWANPFFVAAARRGEPLLTHSHHRAMIDWYLHSMEPYAPDWTTPRLGDAEQAQRNLPPTWTSHGDGGDEGPALWTLSMWHYFYPQDPKIDFLWQNILKGPTPFAGNYHLIEPLLWAGDGRADAAGHPVDYRGGAALGEKLTWFDPVRSSLITRNTWDVDAAVLQFECRTDSVGASHEHADRGNFTLSALGRQWAKESFRSIESRHHNVVLVDGLGQGFWPGPGRWVGLRDSAWVVLAACDAKEAYDWWWPKGINTDPPGSPRFQFPRWAGNARDAAEFRRDYGSVPSELDPRPSVVAHFRGFEAHDPRMWDEDGWPRRLVHNPVQRAFRTIAFTHGANPYALIVDDFQKDDRERLYEWLMLTGPDTDVALTRDNDLVLCDATVPRDGSGLPHPRKGDRELLVRVLDLGAPAAVHDYQARPSFRLETFEKKDTTSRDGRSFGTDKRLVIASRSVAPRFKILLYPLRAGDPLPVTEWNAARDRVTIEVAGRRDEFAFAPGADGRSHVAAQRGGVAVGLP